VALSWDPDWFAARLWPIISATGGPARETHTELAMQRLFSAALMLAVATAATAEDKKDTFDPKSITGAWVIVSGVKFGDKLDAKSLGGDVTVTADKITIKAPDKTHVMSYKLDAGKTPVKIDMEGLEGDAKGFKSEGIIEVKGNEWRLAYAYPGEKRPEKFESPKDSKILMFTMKKK
jgi:uncharacterized protein (TIGR03067 family)